MDSCNYHDKCNCLKDCSCPPSYECCSESENTGKVAPTYGHCVKENTCNRKTGFCKSNDPNIRYQQKENFDVYMVERYGKDTNWVFFLVLIILVLSLGGYFLA